MDAEEKTGGGNQTDPRCDLRSAGPEIPTAADGRSVENPSDPQGYSLFSLAAFEGLWLAQKGLIVEVNEQAARMLGYEPSEIIGRSGYDFIAPDQLETVRQRVLSDSERPYETRLRRKDGSVFPAEIRHLTRLHQGVVSRVTALRDISDRKQSEETLRRLSVAIEQAAEEVIITDAEAVIQYVNPAFTRITGYNPAEAIGQTPRLLKSGIHDGAFYARLWGTITAGKVWTGRLTNRRKDGRVIQEDATISPILNAAGQVTGYVSLKRDITDEVRLEVQLRQAQKMEAIGTLAGGIAHDFNNILGAIMGYTELSVAQLRDRPKVVDALEQVLMAAERARDLVQQILTFSRRSEQEIRPTPLSPLVKEVTRFLRASIPKTIAIKPQIETKADVVMADLTQMHQVLMNLCTNAAYAMREGGGTLVIGLQEVTLTTSDLPSHPSLREGRYLCLTVADTGPGILPQHLERIFEPYFTTKQKGEGTGLGLSVVDGIVRKHNGDITVSSEVGKGSVFQVYLPAAETGAKEAGQRSDAALPGGSEAILFVDDEPMLAQVAKLSLEELGYRVVALTDPATALEAFRRDCHAFDLVITDKTMPQMTGFEMAREIRKIRPDMPVILCSGFQDGGDLQKQSSHDIRHFITKPVVKQAWARTVRAALDEKSDPPAAAGATGGSEDPPVPSRF